MEKEYKDKICITCINLRCDNENCSKNIVRTQKRRVSNHKMQKLSKK